MGNILHPKVCYVDCYFSAAAKINLPRNIWIIDRHNGNFQKLKLQTKEASGKIFDTEFALDVQRILEGYEKRTTIMASSINFYANICLLCTVEYNRFVTSPTNIHSKCC